MSNLMDSIQEDMAADLAASMQREASERLAAMSAKQDVYAAAVTLLCLLGNGQLPPCLTTAYYEAQGYSAYEAILNVLQAKQQLFIDFQAGHSQEPLIQQLISRPPRQHSSTRA
eukprot:gene8693-8874_t